MDNASDGALPASAQKFSRAAQDRGVSVDIVTTPEPARTAEEAARACACDVGQIVKSLIFRGTDTGRPLLFLVSGRNRVDEAAAAASAGEPISRPNAAFVREATGYAIGGIPPFGHDRPAATFIDAALLAYPLVWAAGGHPSTVFAIDPADLRRITEATVMEFG